MAMKDSTNSLNRQHLTKPASKTRWGIAVILGIGILINYVDRLSIGIVASPIQQEFGLSATQFGIIGSAFIWTYALAQVPSGILLDRLGTSLVWRISMFIWALSSFITALATGFWVIIVARLILGLAEAPIMSGAMKATGQWFPINERSLATAIFDSGTRLANVIGLPLIALTVSIWGWREAFWLQGILSIIYLLFFWYKYSDPKTKQHKNKLSREEYQYIIDGGATTSEDNQFNWEDFKYLLKQRKVWGLSLGLAGVGYMLWMLLTWLPGYLQMQFEQDILESGLYTAIQGLAMFVVEISIGGVIIDHLIDKGFNANKVRKSGLVIGILISFLAIGSITANTASQAIIWISLGSAGMALVYVVSNTIPALIAPEGQIGTVASIMNCVNLTAGLVSPIVTGEIVDITGDFKYAFIIGGIILILGLLSYMLLMGRIEKIPSRQTSTE